MNKVKLLVIAPLLFVAQFSFALEDTLAVKSIKGITDKMLDLISVEIGEDVNWDEYRNLFLPRSQKYFIRKGKDGRINVRSMNLEEFIRNVGPLYARDGFEEYSIGLEINEFNGIANVFQSFYCKNLKGTYEKRGINSFQLIYADDRWWIASTTFSNESEDSPLPEKFIDPKHREK